MTHSLHRMGKEEDLQRDYVLLVTPAAYINHEGTAPMATRRAQFTLVTHLLRFERGLKSRWFRGSDAASRIWTRSAK